MMNDRPNWVWENMRTAFGTPASEISSGIVTCFSTSSAARPGIQGDDVHLRVGDVGKRLDRQRQERRHAAPDEEHHASTTKSG